MKPLHGVGLAGLIAGLWLLWPLLRPQLAPVSGTTLVVVFDGGHRLDAALTRTSPQQPLLLIRCPTSDQPTPEHLAQAQRQHRVAFQVLGQGFDSATQIAALARWLQHPPAPMAPLGQLLLVSDGFHLQRLVPVTRVAVGSLGLRVQGLPADALGQPQTAAPWPIIRDWWRLQLWRLSGSTGTFLVPTIRHEKQKNCGWSD